MLSPHTPHTEAVPCDESQPLHSSVSVVSPAALSKPKFAGWLRSHRETWSCFASTSWRPRFCMIHGRYFYRFLDASDASMIEPSPKGCPIPLDACEIRVGTGILSFPEEPHVFALWTLRKVHYFAADSAEELEEWVQWIKAAQEHAVKVKLGHIDQEYSERYADSLASDIVSRKERIDADSTDREFSRSMHAAF